MSEEISSESYIERTYVDNKKLRQGLCLALDKLWTLNDDLISVFSEIDRDQVFDEEYIPEMMEILNCANFMKKDTVVVEK